MRFCVIQPGYFSAIPVFARAMNADLVVWADSFTFNKHSEINRTIIKTIAGPKWLTIPVFSTPDGGASISAIRIDNHEKWQEKHKRTLEINYRNAAYYHYYRESLEPFFNQVWLQLEEILWKSFTLLAQELHCKAEIVKSSTLPHQQDRSARVVAWGRELACDTYLYPEEDENYINRNKIIQAGMQLHRFSLSPFSWFQQYEDILFPLSALDLLLNEGPEAVPLIKRNCRVTLTGQK